jgi:UPF0271 protein
MGGQNHEGTGLFVLDTGAILQGLNLVASTCWTTPSVLDEVRAGGATGRRAQFLTAGGLNVASPTSASLDRVAAAVARAHVGSRLSATDRDVMALALDRTATLVTDDYTVQDLAGRLGVSWQPATTTGVTKTADWTARCAGCGRPYGPARAGKECPVCGAEIRLKRRR